MLEFYKKAALFTLALTFATALLALFCVQGFFQQDRLLPPERSEIPWEVVSHSGLGNSEINVLSDADPVRFNYTLNDKVDYPYVKLFLAFGDLIKADSFADLSAYNKLSFRVHCSPLNVMTVNLRTFDARSTKPGDIGSYRMASHWFNCFGAWSKVEFDIRHMEVPVWWLDSYGGVVHDRRYELDQVVAISFDSSRRGLIAKPIQVQITDLVLERYNWVYVTVFSALSCVAWGSFAFWFYRQHSSQLIRDLQQKARQDKPLFAYQQLTIESHKNKERESVLDYLAKSYTNPELNQETLMKDLGLNSKKVNEILREELGFTFRAYINKLRLTEAARLVCDKPELNISEIALSVGYKNVTHFNKLFKDEFGCSPKKFKKLHDS